MRSPASRPASTSPRRWAMWTRARSRQAVAQADVVVLELAAAAGITPDENAMLESLRDRPAVVAINKADVGDAGPLCATIGDRFPAVATVATSGDGLHALTEAIV